MPLYMIQARFTATAWDALYESKDDRRSVLSKMLEGSGGSLVDYYFAFGDYDVVIANAPDNGTAASAVIAIARAGAVTEIKTTVLMSYEEGIDAIQRSADMGYSPPGTQSG